MRLPDLTRLRYFVAVADTLNFRQASEQLNIAQPAVSRAIQMLEAELGYKLLARTTRRVTLTEAGSVLARDARQAMQLLERSVRHSRQLASGKAGEIIVAYSAQAAHGPMADIVIRFRNALPSASVSLYQMASHEQLQAIENGQIDLGFMLSAACKPPLSHIRVVAERFVLLVSRYHPFSGRTSIALSEVKDAQFVMGTNKRWETFRSLVNSACLTSGFLPTVVEEADDVPVLLQLVSLQRGVTPLRSGDHSNPAAGCRRSSGQRSSCIFRYRHSLGCQATDTSGQRVHLLRGNAIDGRDAREPQGLKPDLNSSASADLMMALLPKVPTEHGACMLESAA